MLEIAGLFLSVLAITWTRKADIAQSLSTPEGAREVARRLRDPQRLYLWYVARILIFARYHIERGPQMYFALFFLSIALTSFAYTLSWAIHGSPAILRPNSIGASWSSKLWFILTMMLFALCYTLNKQGARFERFLSERSQFSLFCFRVGAAFAISVVLWYTTRSLVLFFVTLLTSLLCAAQPSRTYDRMFVVPENPRRLAFAGAFGPVALLVVAFSILAGGQPLDVPASIVAGVAVVLSATVSGFACYRGCKLASGGGFRSTPRWARASVSMGIHITDSMIGFASAVFIAGLLPAVLAQLGLGTVSISVGVLLTCAIFFAGARTLAGAGVVIAIVITLTSVIFFVASADAVSYEWIESLLFWTIIPVISASFAYVTVSMTQIFLRLIRSIKSIVPILFMADLTVAVLLFLLQIAVLIAVLVILNMIFAVIGYNALTIDLDRVIAPFLQYPVAQGLWLTTMISITLIPTTIHFVIVVLGGIAQFCPTLWRERIRKQVDELCMPRRQNGCATEPLAWKLVIFDSISGAVIFALIMYIGGRIGWIFIDSVQIGIAEWIGFMKRVLSRSDITAYAMLIAVAAPIVQVMFVVSWRLGVVRRNC